MADITVTAGNVVQGTDAVTGDGTAGETLTAGQVVYRKASDSGKFWKAQCDGTSAEATCVGIALNGGSAGQPIRIQTAGGINPGGTVAVGTVYAVSATAGGIAPITDLTTGHYITTLGVGTTTSNIKLSLLVSGVQKA